MPFNGLKWMKNVNIQTYSSTFLRITYVCINRWSAPIKEVMQKF